jgi:DNA-3-methyladenine glycosylase
VKRSDLAHPAHVLAPRLLGARLVRTLDDGRVLAGRIVEVEAYAGVEDAACHAHRGRRTPRNESMYARAGTAYVYFTYGMHFCMNIVCAREGDPHAVLVRALEPVDGLEAMRAHRLAPSRPGKARVGPRDGGRQRVVRDADLCRGPANLCKALGIDRALDGIDLFDAAGPLRLVSGGLSRAERAAVVRTPRIGIDSAGAWVARPLRWLLAGHPAVSGPRVAAPGSKGPVGKGSG